MLAWASLTRGDVGNGGQGGDTGRLSYEMSPSGIGWDTLFLKRKSHFPPHLTTAHTHTHHSRHTAAVIYPAWILPPKRSFWCQTHSDFILGLLEMEVPPLSEPDRLAKVHMWIPTT